MAHKTSILAIVPYEGMKEQMTALARQRSDLDLTVYIGDMEEGALLAKTLVKSRFDAILSRGATANRIKKVVSIPVIDIMPSVLDVLRCIRLAQSYDGAYAIVAYSSITNNIEKVFELLNQPINVHTLPDGAESHEITNLIVKLKKSGVSLIIGGAHTAKITRQLNMESILISSGQESILAAFDLAIRMHQATLYQMQQSHLYLRLLEQNEIGVLVYSQTGELQFSDLPSSFQDCSPIIEKVEKYVPIVMEGGEIHTVRKVKNLIWHIDGVREAMQDDTVAAFTLRCAQSPYKDSDSLVRYCHAADEAPGLSLANNANDMQLSAQLAAYARTLSPVWIMGEEGTPLEDYARYLHKISAWNNRTLVFIDCAALNQRSFTMLLENEASPLNEVRLTICMEHLDRLTYEQQSSFIHYASSTFLSRRNRMFFIASRKLDSMSPLAAYAVQTGDFRLVLPSLTEHKEDIRGLCSLYLARLNAELGCQVIGLDKAAEELLCRFDWPENNRQLMRVLRQLVLTVQDGLIEEKELARALRSEAGETAAPALEDGMLKGTLEEINTRIIQTVLAQEGMSRTRTLQRLNISRSTLWRMLKKVDE